jgi:hypothetical protein
MDFGVLGWVRDRFENMFDGGIPSKNGKGCNKKSNLVVETMMGMTVMMTMASAKGKARKGKVSMRGS